MEEKQKYDLVVIGGGPAGYTAAVKAAEYGYHTALVEADSLGGTCLNRGCIPTKTLLYSAELYEKLKNGRIPGVSAENISCSVEALWDRKAEVVETLRQGIWGMLKKAKVDVYEGKGKITDRHSVQVNGEILNTEKILITTGAVPSVPPILGVDAPGVVTSDELLNWNGPLPQRLVIIGGGVIGMEFASLYQALGSQVVVIEAMDRLLGTMDREIGQSLKILMKKRGVEIHTGTKVERIETADGLSVIATEKEKTVIAGADAVLVAVGRRAYTESLLGEELNLKVERGKILVNENFETSIPGIYAAGDCIGGIQLAHVAQAEAVNAVCAMMNRPPAFDSSVIPSCVYTNPEIASVGMTAEEAKSGGRNIISAKYPMAANGKTLLSGGERGFVKILADEQTGQIAGAQLMCERASDLVSLFGEALVNHLTTEDLERVIYPHPTFVEGIGEALHLMHGKEK